MQKKINNHLEAELENENRLEKLSAIEDNGEEINEKVNLSKIVKPKTDN